MHNIKAPDFREPLFVEKADFWYNVYADAHWASLQIGCFTCVNVGTTIGRLI